MSADATADCRICGGSLRETLLTHDVPDRFERHAGVPDEGYTRRWRACGRCGSAQNELPEASSRRLGALAADYYEVDFPDTVPAERFATIMALPATRSDNAGRVARVRGFLDGWPPARAEKERLAVDVGAGLGVFLARFRQEEASGPRVWRLLAVEPDRRSSEHLQSIAGLEVCTGKLDAGSGLCGASLVTLNKVLEHVSEPRQLLADAARILQPRHGVIYVEVPDVLTIGRRPPADNILGALHHHLYSLRGLEAVFHAVGLLPLRVERVVEPSGKLTVFGFACLPAAFDTLASSS